MNNDGKKDTNLSSIKSFYTDFLSRVSKIKHVIKKPKTCSESNILINCLIKYFSNDIIRIIISYYDYLVGELDDTLVSNGDQITKFIVLPNRQIVTGGYGKALRIWNIDTKKCIRTLKLSRHQCRLIICIIGFPDGRIICCSSGCVIHIFDLVNNTKQKLTTSVYIKCIAVLSDNPIKLIIGSFFGTLHIWNVETGKCEKILIGHNFDVKNIVFHPDGRIISYSVDSIRVWNKNNIGICDLVIEQEYIESFAIFSYDHIVFGLSNGDIHLWNLKTDSSDMILRLNRYFIKAVSCSSLLVTLNKMIFAGMENGDIVLWDPRYAMSNKKKEIISTKIVYEIRKVHTHRIESISVLSDKKLLINVADTIRIWNFKSDEIIIIPTKIYDFFVLPDGRIICSTYTDIDEKKKKHKLEIWSSDFKKLTDNMY